MYHAHVDLRFLHGSECLWSSSLPVSYFSCALDIKNPGTILGFRRTNAFSNSAFGPVYPAHNTTGDHCPKLCSFRSTHALITFAFSADLLSCCADLPVQFLRLPTADWLCWEWLLPWEQRSTLDWMSSSNSSLHQSQLRSHSSSLPLQLLYQCSKASQGLAMPSSAVMLKLSMAE